MCNQHRRLHLPRGTSRRDVLRFTLGGLGLAALGPLAMRRMPVASGAPQNLTRAVFVNLIGGNDGFNTVIPRDHQTQYDTRRPNIKITSGAQLLLDQGPNATTRYGLHPALDRIQALWNEGSVALVHKVGYPDANLSHFTSMDVQSYGVRGSFGPLGVPISGWVARFADAFAPTLLGAVAVGVGRPLDFVGGNQHLLIANDLPAFNFQGDPVSSAQDAQHRLQVVRNVLAGYAGAGVSAEVKTALDLGHQLVGQMQQAVANYTTAVMWPASPIGNFLKDVSLLVQGGFETRIFYTGFGGFDTHADQGGVTGLHATLLGRLDDAVGAFAQDMKNRGQWNNTRIVVFSEFGRRNYQSFSGTDHGGASEWLVIGGGLNGGSHGPDIQSTDLDGGFPAYAVDFRDVYRDVLVNHLGVPNTDTVFPEAQPIAHVLGIA